MTYQILLMLLTIGAGLVLFSFEWLPADVIAIGLLLFVTMTGLLPADQAFVGFGNDAVVMILGLLILTAALIRTGVVDWVGRTIILRMGKQPNRLLLIVMVVAGVISSFISNTAATAFLIPVVIGVGHKAQISTSKLLMPLAFASILSSSVTLVATSTNIVVSGLMVQNGLNPLGMFELAPVGLPIVITGIAYMYWIGRRMIPERGAPENIYEEIGTLPYLTEAVILPGSPLANKTLAQSGLGRELDLTVLRVTRNDRNFFAPQADLQLAEGDILLLEGKRDEILKIKDEAGMKFRADVQFSSPELQNDSVHLVEAIVLPKSPLLGRTIEDAKFREQYSLQVLAINQHGETLRSNLRQISVQLGDVLLVQGHRSNIAAMEADQAFRVIGKVTDKSANLERAPIAILAFAGSLLLATLNIFSLPVAIMLGVFVVFVTRCITPEEAYREVEWKALILIACMLGVGKALESSGAAAYLAGQIVTWLGEANPIWLLAGFFTLTMLLTQPMSNQAAAVVVVPIALQTAVQLGLNPRAFAVMIAVGASCSYLTPLEPSCLMVYGPGRYRFGDFLKVGSLLTLIIFLIAIVLVPVLWPL